jgi:hypothetical protein
MAWQMKQQPKILIEYFSLSLTILFNDFQEYEIHFYRFIVLANGVNGSK